MSHRSPGMVSPIHAFSGEGRRHPDTQTLAAAMGPRGVRVNAVSPRLHAHRALEAGIVIGRAG